AGHEAAGRHGQARTERLPVDEAGGRGIRARRRPLRGGHRRTEDLRGEGRRRGGRVSWWSDLGAAVLEGLADDGGGRSRAPSSPVVARPVVRVTVGPAA